jgi:hypothetical protein
MADEGRGGRCRAVLLKRSLLALWSVWWTVVFASNVADAAEAGGLLGEGWAFASGNYRFLVETTARYGPPAWLNGLLFGGVIAWEGLAAGLFWRAWWRFGGAASSRPKVYAAFTAGLVLWLAFLVADELCIAYPVEGTHARLFTAQLATLLAVELLPERGASSPGDGNTTGR